MQINEACYHLANGKTMKVEGVIIRLIGGYYQYYCEKECKWLFTEGNGISQYQDSQWKLVDVDLPQ